MNRRATQILVLAVLLLGAASTTGCISSTVRSVVDDTLNERTDFAVRDTLKKLDALGIGLTDASVLCDRSAPKSARLEEAAALLVYMFKSPDYSVAQVVDLGMQIFVMLGLDYAPRAE